jgi:hypothetical protein
MTQVQLAQLKREITIYPFGCLVHFAPPNPQKLKSLENRRTPGIFVGYTQTGKGEVIVRGPGGRLVHRLEQQCTFDPYVFPLNPSGASEELDPNLAKMFENWDGDTPDFD